MKETLRQNARGIHEVNIQLFFYFLMARNKNIYFSPVYFIDDNIHSPEHTIYLLYRYVLNSRRLVHGSKRNESDSTKTAVMKVEAKAGRFVARFRRGLRGSNLLEK